MNVDEFVGLGVVVMLDVAEEELRDRFVGLSGGAVLPWGGRGRFFDFWAAGLYCLICIIPGRRAAEGREQNRHWGLI